MRRACRRRRPYALLPLLGAVAVAITLAAGGSRDHAVLVAAADQPTPTPSCTNLANGIVQSCGSLLPPTPTVPSTSGCAGESLTGTCPPSPSAPTPPLVLPSPAPCPGVVEGTVCLPESAVDASPGSPPALPPTANPPGRCRAAPPPPYGSNSWVQYGATITVDYPQTPNPTAGQPDVYPLSFIPVVDRYQPCRAFRVSVDGHRIERSLDAGQTWASVLDGTAVASGVTPPSFRSIVVAAPDDVVATETANGDALVTSHDGGTTWVLADGRPGDAANLIGEFAYTVVAGPTGPGGAPGDLYVATLACASHTRPVSSQDCGGSTSPNGRVDTGEGGGGPVDLGPVRIYASHDGGGHWQRIGDDGLSGVPEHCSVAWLYIVADPFTTPARDHVWIAFANGALVSQCPATGNLAELQGDGVGGYLTLPMGTRSYAGFAPFVVVPGPSGERLVSGDVSEGYSDNDGVTWTAVQGLSQLYPSVVSLATDEHQDVVGFVYAHFPANDSGDTVDLRPVVHRPADPRGIADVELGAALPPPPGQPDRSLFNYPHYDPLIPTLPRLAEALGATTGPNAADIEYDGHGNFYVPVGDACYTAGCGWDGAVPDSRAGTTPNSSHVKAAQWRLMRYTMAPAGTLPVLRGLPSTTDEAQQSGPHTTARCKNQGRCNLVPLRACTIQAPPYQGAPDLNGTLAYDGAELLYTRSFERSADSDPYSAVVRRLDPKSCADAGTITVHFPQDEYLRARALTWVDFGWFGPWLSQPQYPATRPLIDSLTYDATHDRVYFTLRSEGVPNRQQRSTDAEAGDPNQLSLWAADLHSAGGVPAASVTASLVSLTTGHCPGSNADEAGAGSRTLAFDRIGDNLAIEAHPDGAIYACLPGRPAELDTSGRQIDEPCYGAYEMDGHVGAGLDAAAWTMEDESPLAGRHRAFLYLDETSSTGGSTGQVAVYDLAGCQEDRLYGFPASLHVAPMGSTALACDPATFGIGAPGVSAADVARLEASQQVPPFTGTLKGAVLWSRVGPSLQASLIPDNGDPEVSDPFPTQTCRLPVDLTYTGPGFVAPGSTAVLTARLSVHGPDAPVANQVVTMQVNGVKVADLHTRADGTVTYAYTAPAGGQLLVDLSFEPPAGDVAYYAATAFATVTVGIPAVPPAPGAPPLPPVPLVAPVVPHEPAPIAPFQAGPQPAAPALAPPQGGQGNTVSQGQGQPAAAKQREEQQQLALALAGDPDQQPAEAGQAGPPGSEGASGTGDTPGDASYSMTAVQHGDPGDPALAMGAGLIASSFGVLVALRMRARHALERELRGAGRVRRRQRRRGR